MKAPITLLALVLAAGSASAQAPSPTRVAMQVAAAYKAGKPLDKLAAVAGVDPWKVVHELRMRGKAAVARAYAQAVRTGAGDALRKYLDSAGDRPPDPDGAKAMAEYNRRAARGDFKGALAATEGIVGPGATITATRLAVARGISLIRLGRMDEGTKALARAAALARQIGWEFVVALERLTAARMTMQRDPRKALEAATEALAIRERLGDPVELTETLVIHAELLARTGDIAAADKDLARALEVSKGLSLHPQIGTSLYTALGNRALQSRNLKDAVRYYELELPLRRALGDRTGLAAVQVNLGMAYVGVGEYEKAVPHLEQGRTLAQLVRRMGWVKNALGSLANAYRELGKDRKAIEANWALLKLIGPTGNERSAVIAYEQIAFLELRGGNIASGTKAGNAMIALWMQLGDKLGAANAITRIAAAHSRAGDYARADELLTRALALDPDGSPSRLALAGFCAARVGDEARALLLVEQARKRAEATGDEQLVAAVLLDYATVVAGIKDARGVRPHLERALAIAEKGGDAVLVGRLAAALAQADAEEFDHAAARACAQRALAVLPARGPGSAATRALALRTLGQAEGRLGDLVRAQATLEEAVVLANGLPDRRLVATSLAGLASVYAQAGEHARALAAYTRARRAFEQLGDGASVARTLGEMGDVYATLGQLDKALELQALRRDMSRKKGAKIDLAATLVNMGIVYDLLGRPDDARQAYEEGIALSRAAGIQEWEANATGNLGMLHREQGDHAAARRSFERCRAIHAQLGTAREEAIALCQLARLDGEAGELDNAQAGYEAALVLAGEAAGPELAAWALEGLASVQLARGQPRAALATLHAAAEKLQLVVSGLADRAGATIRERWADLSALGVRAALATGQPEEALFFLETGRAGGLLESLGVRTGLAYADVSEDLKKREQAARLALSEAHATLAAARRTRKRKRIKSARQAVREREQALVGVIDDIQQGAKAAADLYYPRAASLAQVRESLAAGDAYVAYHMAPDAAHALVVTRKAARIVPLGKGAALESIAIDAAAPGGPNAMAAARAALVEPLGLDDAIRRVLIAPDGGLAYVPFVALLPGRDCAYVQSATTHRMLRERAAPGGTGVLALGDPVYAGAGAAATRAMVRMPLQSLPATRAEVEKLGDVTLLGEHASESGFAEALAQQPRWRAVHFACHGLVDVERPELSALALSAEERHDGMLTVHEVLRLRVPADLITLSACESGRGKVYRAEGVMGFTRAFMQAGSPRVLCSLWKVDDEATAALMVKFYELWKPGTTGTAAALRKAQQFVASHEKWKHPRYWAAWQLWGLPD